MFFYLLLGLAVATAPPIPTRVKLTVDDYSEDPFTCYGEDLKLSFDIDYSTISTYTLPSPPVSEFADLEEEIYCYVPRKDSMGRETSRGNGIIMRHNHNVDFVYTVAGDYFDDAWTGITQFYEEVLDAEFPSAGNLTEKVSRVDTPSSGPLQHRQWNVILTKTNFATHFSGLWTDRRSALECYAYFRPVWKNVVVASGAGDISTAGTAPFNPWDYESQLASGPLPMSYKWVAHTMDNDATAKGHDATLTATLAEMATKIAQQRLMIQTYENMLSCHEEEDYFISNYYTIKEVLTTMRGDGVYINGNLKYYNFTRIAEIWDPLFNSGLPAGGGRRNLAALDFAEIATLLSDTEDNVKAMTDQEIITALSNLGQVVIVDETDGTVLTETEELLLSLVEQTSFIDEIRALEASIDTLQATAETKLTAIEGQSSMLKQCAVIIPQRGTVLTTNYILSQKIDAHLDPRA